MSTISPDRLAELEEERRFLLRSLKDLEREYEAGDVDEVDYRELKDGYTARAAATMRAIEAGQSALPERPPPNWPRRIGIAAVCAVLVAVVWWALSASSAQRLPGQEITGQDPRSEQAQILAQARVIQAAQPDTAAALYAEVLELDPDNEEALTYRGWTLAITALSDTDADDVTATLRESVDLLSEAIEVAPDYADPHCFLGIIQGRFLGDAEAAVPFVDRCLSQDPPASVRELVEAYRESLADQIDNG